MAADNDNLRIQQELTKAVQKMAEGQAAAQQHVEAQFRILTEMKSLLKSGEIERSFDTFGSSGKKATDALKQGTKELSSETQLFNQQLKESIGDYPLMKVAGLAALDGLVSGFQAGFNVMKATLGLVHSLGEGFWQVGKSILAIPFKILDALIQKAQSFSGDTSLAQAFEDLRKEFGSFKQDVSKNVITSFNSLKGELSNTGLSVFRVLGNLAERLKYVSQIAHDMGATFHSLGPEIAANAEAIVAYKKGLGVADDEMKGFGARAITMGQDVSETFRQVANYSIQLGESFNLSQKVLSKDVSKMIKDVKNFGSLSVKEMTQVSVYTRKLGIEVEKLLGVIDKFDTFEDAATSAAQLSQSFGLTVDAFQQMQEQDPAKRVDHLRQAMQAAGKSAENMSRQELKLLAQTTGLDEATAKQAFSSKNLGVSFNELEKKGAVAEKRQLSQAEAMVKLADSIERLVKQGQSNFKSFFDAFLQGVNRGIQSSPEFIRVMFNIRQALWTTFGAGIQVGRDFVQSFLGVNQTFKALGDMFSPAKFRQLFYGLDPKNPRGLIAAFHDLFVELNTNDPKQAIRNFMDKVKSAFEAAFGKDSMSILKNVADGFRKVGLGMARAIAGMIPNVAAALAKTIDTIVGFLKDPKQLTSGLNASDAKKGVMEFIAPLAIALGEAWVILKPAIGRLLEFLRDQFVEFARSPAGRKVITGFFGMLFGPAILGAALKTALAGVGGLLTKGLTKSLTTGFDSAAVGASKSVSKLGGVLGKLGPVAMIAAASMGVSKGLREYKDKLTGGLDETAKVVGSSAAGIVDSLTFGLLPEGLAQSLAQGAAELADVALKQLEKSFGKGFTQTFKDYLKSNLELLGALGDVISSIFSGDTTKISDAIMKFGEKLVPLFVSMFNWVVLVLPLKLVELAGRLFTGIFSVLFKVSAQLMSKFADKIEDIPVVGPVLASIVRGFAYFNEEIGEFFDEAGETIKEKFGWLSDKIGGAVNTIKSLFGQADVVQSNELKDKIAQASEKVKSDAASGAEQLSKAANEVTKVMDEKMGTSFDMKAKDFKRDPEKFVANVQDVTSKLSDLKTMIDKMDIGSINQSLQKLSSVDFSVIGKDAAVQVESASKFLESVTGFTKFVDGLSETTERMKTATLSKTINAVRDMVKKVQDLNDAMSDDAISKIQVVPRLQKLAASAGLGANGTFTVKNKDFTIKLNVKVVMEADKIERVILENDKGFIRDKLTHANYPDDAYSGDNKLPVPTYSKIPT